MSTLGWIVTAAVIFGVSMVTEKYWGPYASKVPVVGNAYHSLVVTANSKVGLSNGSAGY